MLDSSGDHDGVQIGGEGTLSTQKRSEKTITSNSVLKFDEVRNEMFCFEEEMLQSLFMERSDELDEVGGVDIIDMGPLFSEANESLPKMDSFNETEDYSLCTQQHGVGVEVYGCNILTGDDQAGVFMQRPAAPEVTVIEETTQRLGSRKGGNSNVKMEHKGACVPLFKSASSSLPVSSTPTSCSQSPPVYKRPLPTLPLPEPIPFVLKLWDAATNEELYEQCSFSSCGTAFVIKSPRVFFSAIVPKVYSILSSPVHDITSFRLPLSF